MNFHAGYVLSPHHHFCETLGRLLGATQLYTAASLKENFLMHAFSAQL